MRGFVPSLTARRMASAFGAISSQGPAGFHELPVEVVVRSGVSLTSGVSTSLSTPANNTRNVVQRCGDDFLPVETVVMELHVRQQRRRGSFGASVALSASMRSAAISPEAISTPQPRRSAFRSDDLDGSGPP